MMMRRERMTDMGNRTFEEIADAQGWNVDSEYEVLREFVRNSGLDKALAVYAEWVAEEENGEG